MRWAPPIQRLLDELERLPGVGPKSAQRIAYWLLSVDAEQAERLSSAITEVKATIHFCPRCFNFAEGELCVVCADPERDTATICIVEEPRDLAAIERTHEYHGVYHVLHGAISPIDGIGPDQLKVRELIARLGDSQVTELIVATNPNVEGETTAMYLRRLIEPLGVRMTRIASGLPVGGDLEFADEVTLGRALECRREM